MLKLPTSTYVGKFIPKDKFYIKTSISNTLRQLFTDEIVKITWQNKIAPDTLNITSKEYAELQVFTVTLKKSTINTSVLKYIDAHIPYPILYILIFSDLQKAEISYKEPSSKNQNQMNVDSYYETSWQKELNLELKGRSVDEIYKNFLFQIAPNLKETNHSNMKSAIEAYKAALLIQKQIDIINRRIANEPSIAKKQVLARARHILEKQLLIVNS